MVTKTPNNRSDIFGMMLPRKAPAAVPVWLDFSNDLANDLDLTFVIDQGWVDFISGVFINNTSDEILQIKVNGGTYQTVPFPARTSGYVPLLFSNPPKVTISSPNNFATQIQALFYNVPMLPYLYPNAVPAGQDVNIAAIGGSPVAGPDLPVTGPLTDAELRAAPVPVTTGAIAFTDYSLGLTGGNDVAVAAGNAARYLVIYNPPANNSLFVNLAGGDASVSGMELPPGMTLTLESGVSNAVTVSGTAAEGIFVYGGV